MRIHRKQPPQAAKNIWGAHSIYTAGLGVPDRRRYRRTPLRRAERRRSRAARRHGLYLLQHRRCRNRGEGMLLCSANRRDVEANTDEVFVVDSASRAQEPSVLQNHPHFVNAAAEAADESLCIAPASDSDRRPSPDRHYPTVTRVAATRFMFRERCRQRDHASRTPS